MKGSGLRQTWTLIAAQSLISCVTLAKLCNSSSLSFSICKMDS